MIQTTMQDGELTIARLVEYSRRVFPEAKITTWTGEGLRDLSFAEVGDKAAQLAHALTKLGVQRGDRVATFMWNNNEHQVAYAGVPAMGAVLHTLNIRLFPEQLVYIANHAEDDVVFVPPTSRKRRGKAAAAGDAAHPQGGVDAAVDGRILVAIDLAQRIGDLVDQRRQGDRFSQGAAPGMAGPGPGGAAVGAAGEGVSGWGASAFAPPACGATCSAAGAGSVSAAAAPTGTTDRATAADAAIHTLRFMGTP